MAKPSYKKIFVRVLLLFIYLLIGAAVFQLLERANQLKMKRRYNEVLKGFMLEYNVTLVDMRILEELISYNGKHSESTNWSYGNAVVFAGTTLLTVGYGNIVPKTTGGRAFCIIYALIGIPIACLALKSLGERITVFEASLIKAFYKVVYGHDRVHAIHLKASILNFAITIIAILSLAGMAKLKRNEWSFFECIYFVFITFTTIGFGDYLPTYRDSLSEYDILTIVLGFFIGFSLVSSLLCSVSNALEEQGRTVLRKARKTIVSRKGKRSMPSSYSMESELATSNCENGKAEEKSPKERGIALRKVSTKHEKGGANGKELALAKVVFENEHVIDGASRSS